MAPKSLDRARLVALMIPAGAPPEAPGALDRALAALGWQDKQAFTKDDVMALTMRLADDACAALAASADPDAQAAGAAMAPALAFARQQMAKARAADPS